MLVAVTHTERDALVILSWDDEAEPTIEAVIERSTVVPETDGRGLTAADLARFGAAEPEGPTTILPAELTDKQRDFVAVLREMFPAYGIEVGLDEYQDDGTAIVELTDSDGELSVCYLGADGEMIGTWF